MSHLSDLFSREISLFEEYLPSVFADRFSEQPHLAKLYESIRYSVDGGGKRFRPAIALLTAQVLGEKPEVVLPFAAAVEFIHTYSLIHDDLPLMDDDDFRRGEPTNHKVYGEAMALLAGDALQSLAFECLAAGYIEQRPKEGLEVVRLLAGACGADGMVGGQVIDIAVLEGASRSEADLLLLHGMKTGALIRVAVEGAAVLSNANDQEREALRRYAELTGLSFQLADDLLDFDPKDPERSGLPSLIGKEKTLSMLRECVDGAVVALTGLEYDTSVLEKLVRYNLDRSY